MQGASSHQRSISKHKGWMDGCFSELRKTKNYRRGPSGNHLTRDCRTQPAENPLAAADTPGLKSRYKKFHREGDGTTVRKEVSS